MTARAASPSPKKGDLLRWVIWPVLVLVVIVAVFEILPKRRAAATATAWREALNGTGEFGALRASELGALVSGSPAKTEAEPPEAVVKEMPFVEKTLVYTWSGPFRKHVVRVHVSRGSDPEVEKIDGP